MVLQAKSWIAAALLCLFLGGLGLHNFYLGYTGRGIGQLVLLIVGWISTLVFVGGLLLFALFVWVFVEFIMILTRSGNYGHDNLGIPLR
ncbi:NINE protein [Corynebacterium uberis]|nr:NINE protein [Corynebacterium uberis]